MGTLVKTSLMCLCCLTMFSLAACGDDDEGGGGGGTGGGGSNPPTGELISTNVPSQQGWSSVSPKGVCTYVPADFVADPDAEYAAYFAFAVKGDTCQEAVFNMVCESETMAKYLEQMLRSGEWAEDDEDYAAPMNPAVQSLPVVKATLNTRAFKATMKKMRASNNGLGLPCNRSGRVVYFTIDALRGKSMADVKLASKVWFEVADASELPPYPIFGTWDEAAGRYYSTSIYAIPGTSLEAKVKFNAEDIVTDYTETWTFPNTLWASAMYDVILEMAADWEMSLGAEVSVTLKGSSVVVVCNNPEPAQISKSLLLNVIVMVDIINACPFSAMIF